MTHLATDLSFRSRGETKYQDFIAETFNPPGPGRGDIAFEKREMLERLAFTEEQLDQMSDGWRAPPDVQAAFDDLIGSLTTGRYILRMHPLTKRVTVFEEAPTRDEEWGRGVVLHGRLFQYVWSAEEKWQRGVIPSDLRDDPLRWDQASCVGEFRMATRADFAKIRELADNHRVEGRTLRARAKNMRANLMRARDMEKEARKAEFAKQWLDTMEYYDRAIRDIYQANQNLPNTPTLVSPVEPSLPKIIKVQHNGWVERCKVDSAHHEWLKRRLAEEASKRVALGFQSKPRTLEVSGSVEVFEIRDGEMFVPEEWLEEMKKPEEARERARRAQQGQAV